MEVTIVLVQEHALYHSTIQVHICLYLYLPPLQYTSYTTYHYLSLFTTYPLYYPFPIPLSYLPFLSFYYLHTLLLLTGPLCTIPYRCLKYLTLSLPSYLPIPGPSNTTYVE